MGPVWLGMRAELRLRWRALVGLALLLGLVAGVALTAAAGARRTETAYSRLPQTSVQTLASPNRALGATSDRVKILQGRMFGPASVGEAVIDPQLARLEGLRPGDTLRLLGERENPKTQSPDVRLTVPLDFKVAAIAVFDNQVVPDTAADSEPMALLSPSFAATRVPPAITYGPQAPAS
jgi:putative ABC transport system permease protein